MKIVIATDIDGTLTGENNLIDFETISTLHFHVSYDKCLEVVLLRGSSQKIISLISQMENVVGVEMVKFVPADVRTCC